MISRMERTHLLRSTPDCASVPWSVVRKRAGPHGAVVDHRIGDPVDRRLNPPERAAVRDDDDPLDRMPLRDPPDCAHDPVAVVLGRLALELDVDALVAGQAFPVAPVLLAQVRIDHDCEAQPLAYD